MDFIQNAYLNEKDDVLFHLLFSNKTDDLKRMFGDTKFVCLGGTPKRMKDWSKFLMKELNLVPLNGTLKDLTGHGNRYSMFKVGPVICVNHGMGYPSITILLHELAKLMHYAECDNPLFIRLGTSGGIDVEPGTVVIATSILNDFIEPYLLVPILGKPVKRKAELDEEVAKELQTIAQNDLGFPVLSGNMVSGEHFYESTAMKMAAVCENTDEERAEYQRQLRDAKVLCMDMEGLALAAFTNKVGIRSAVVTVVVNDCFTSTVDTPSPETIAEWGLRPMKIACEYMRKRL